ncbi:FMN-binding negative transcriptional regulator [Sphingomonas colocasiae]|uniref:FMN-binding negative transcriptional regulator n=1 Tax=Sphingomonas colocasiae TaxID=1848973 RepID=A0ABS7PXZ0_9SPHN|nr:FMN-binding negative transcriptional regulator [Sphingomonas colocasiae]MBY8826207.1 FMN-binding negative transcriptional regulator [Sphingomonas colocasiae]
MSCFVPRDPADVPALISDHPLGWVVSNGAGGFAATPLPLLAELDGDGRIIALFGHFARANRHVEALVADPRAIILMQGAQGYISPRLVSNPSWGPTWNYAVAKFEVEIAFVPDENRDALVRLAAALEGSGPEAWTIERMGARVGQLLPHIVAFRAHVIAADARFKLGQDEAPGTFEEIVAGLADPVLADAMRHAVGRPIEAADAVEPVRP